MRFKIRDKINNRSKPEKGSCQFKKSEVTYANQPVTSSENKCNGSMTRKKPDISGQAEGEENIIGTWPTLTNVYFLCMFLFFSSLNIRASFLRLWFKSCETPAPVPTAAHPHHLSKGMCSSGLAVGKAGPQSVRPPTEGTCPCRRMRAGGLPPLMGIFLHSLYFIVR